MNPHRILAAASLVCLVGCAAPVDGEEDEETAAAEEAVTSGKVTSARPEIGLVHVDGVRGILGDMGWATGTVALARNTVLTSAQATGNKNLPLRTTGYGTFTVTGRSTHRVVQAQLVAGTKLVLLRISPAVDASIVPAQIATPATVASARDLQTTFFGYGYRNLVCVPLTGSDGHKSYVTRRYEQFGGLFTGPIGAGYTCEGDIGGPIVLGGVGGQGAILSVNVNTVVDSFAEPGRVRPQLESIAQSFQR
jgi:hypothetical protein